MTQLMVPSSTTIENAAVDTDAVAGIVWATPGEDLWVATRTTDEGTAFLGFVERTFEEYVAVDGEGASLGRHRTLQAARAAFRPA